MKITSSFKNFEHTPALDEKINLKSQKMEKFFEGNVELLWTCSVPEGGLHLAEVKVLGPNFEYHASGHSESMYKSLDLVIQKIEKQVSKKKDKRKKHISQKHKVSFKEEQVSQSEWDEKYWEHLNTDLAS